MNEVIDRWAWSLPFSVCHQPPTTGEVMSRLGVRWFEKIEQYLKIALKHLNVSVATPTRGPK